MYDDVQAGVLTPQTDDTYNHISTTSTTSSAKAAAESHYNRLSAVDREGTAPLGNYDRLSSVNRSSGAVAAEDNYSRLSGGTAGKQTGGAGGNQHSHLSGTCTRATDGMPPLHFTDEVTGASAPQDSHYSRLSAHGREHSGSEDYEAMCTQSGGNQATHGHTYARPRQGSISLKGFGGDADA